MDDKNMNRKRISLFYLMLISIAVLVFSFFAMSHFVGASTAHSSAVAGTFTAWVASLLLLLSLRGLPVDKPEWNVFFGLLIVIVAVICNFFLKKFVGFQPQSMSIVKFLSTLILLLGAVAGAHLLLSSAERDQKTFRYFYFAVQLLLAIVTLIISIASLSFAPERLVEVLILIAKFFWPTFLLPVVLWVELRFKKIDFLAFFAPLLGILLCAIAVQSIDVGTLQFLSLDLQTTSLILDAYPYYLYEIAGVPCAILLAQSVIHAQKDSVVK